MSDELKTAVDGLRAAWEGELKPRLDQMDAEAKTAGTATTETKQAVERVNDRMDEFEVTVQKALEAKPQYDNDMSQERKDMEAFTRKGRAGLPAETKVMILGDETTGGILAPADFIHEMIKGVVQFSPVRQYVRVRRTGRQSVKITKRTGLAAAAWTGETTTRTKTATPTYGLEEIPNHELYARVSISNWDLEDPEVDIEADVRDQMSEQFGVSEGLALVSGNGNGKPEGILAAGSGISTVNNGATTFTDAIGANGFIDAKFALKEQYWPNARWLLGRLTLRDVRKLKDLNGNYIWAPGMPGGVSNGLESTIVDSPYTIVPDMPTVASAAKVAAIGDWQRAYTLVDRIEIQYLRDPYTEASAGAVVFHARKRVGGQVVLPEAAKILVMT